MKKAAESVKNLTRGGGWAVEAEESTSDAKVEEALERVEELRRRLAAVWDRFEEAKLAWRELARRRAEGLLAAGGPRRGA